MKTAFYVDAFNLYYGSLKNSPFRWLDLDHFFRSTYPKNHVHLIRYFTAHVKARPHDLQQPIRQQTYLRALNTIPHLTTHLGHYLEKTVRMPLAHPPRGGPAFAEVIKSEEKGSDVNLATYLLADAFDKAFDVAIVVTNDSDLKEPIRLVRQKFGLKVGVLFPVRSPRRPSIELQKVASFHGRIDDAILATTQFPPQLTDAHGTFTKPVNW